MKPIPAIDENDEFVEATLRGGAKRAIATLDNGCGCIIGVLGYWWNLDGSSPQPNSRGWDLIDLPAVRERVERARKARKTEALADQVMRDVMDIGRAFVRIDPSTVISGGATPKRPSFAEALERITRQREWDATPKWHDISRAIEEARAASGE